MLDKLCNPNYGHKDENIFRVFAGLTLRRQFSHLRRVYMNEEAKNLFALMHQYILLWGVSQIVQRNHGLRMVYWSDDRSCLCDDNGSKAPI